MAGSSSPTTPSRSNSCCLQREGVERTGRQHRNGGLAPDHLSFLAHSGFRPAPRFCLEKRLSRCWRTDITCLKAASVPQLSTGLARLDAGPKYTVAEIRSHSGAAASTPSALRSLRQTFGYASVARLAGAAPRRPRYVTVFLPRCTKRTSVGHAAPESDAPAPSWFRSTPR
jgi:hypothetical protein